MSENQLPKPYKQLGDQLRHMRERNLESLAEVSGAVEIESTTLLDYESGLKRPSEDILILLIKHFSPKDNEITQLWEKAGYQDADLSELEIEDFNSVKPIIMMMPMDNRVVYSDVTNIKINRVGVVMNFMQNSNLPNQPLTIARIGMSKEHAKNLLELLKHSLEQAENTDIPKALPKPKHSDQDQPKS
ncbi:MAG TPA: helix-turn-helix transcriptional regulator [Candidatus Saccharimonadales bacterium]|nr:helix-turn-helix transcriptional regulator [Candidatus Saccharimonadales bacterium]